MSLVPVMRNTERDWSLEMYTCSNTAFGICCRYGTLLTEQERRMISERRFTDLTQYQRHLDAEIDAKVCHLHLPLLIVLFNINCGSTDWTSCKSNGVTNAPPLYS